MFRRIAVALAVIAASLSIAPLGHAQSACQFILGFKTLHDMDPNDIGDCMDNQSFAPNGDAQQRSTKGLMAWRKADNWTAFTNGFQTWINGPAGLAQRLNAQRFTWESPPFAPDIGNLQIDGLVLHNLGQRLGVNLVNYDLYRDGGCLEDRGISVTVRDLTRF